MTDLLYQDQTYKEVIKKTLQEKRKIDPELTNKALSVRIPIQPTYFSKFLNDEHSHLKDDTLFRLGKILGFSEDECEFLILKKNYENAEMPDRKEYLLRKINNIRSQRQSAQDTKSGAVKDKLALESMYLLNPKCLLVQLALHIRTYRDNPRLLCGPLNLSPAQLISILDLIEDNGFLKRGEDPFDIKELKVAQFHLESSEIMRLHQYLFKTLIPPKLMEVQESEKKSFLVTFNMDERTYKECVASFDRFIGEVKDISTKAKPDGVYQLSFDLFKWC
jgi:plasmid maintenance system antidote protein VapI